MLTPVDHYIRTTRVGARPFRDIGRPRVLLSQEIDWGKPYHEIAADLGVSIPTVRFEFLRRHPGLRKHIRVIPEPDKPKWQKFKTWDWSKRNTALAKEHGVTRERVRQIREALSIPRYQQFDWSNVDWRMSTREIADALSTTPNTVQYYRRKIGFPWVKPDPIKDAVSKLTEDDWKLSRKGQVQRLKEIDPQANHYWIDRHIRQNPHLKKPSRRDSDKRYSKVKWGEMTSAEIAKIAGVSPGAVLLYAKRHGLKVKGTYRRGVYSNVDWSLSNNEISKLTGANTHAVSEARWRRFGRWK